MNIQRGWVPPIAGIFFSAITAETNEKMAEVEQRKMERIARHRQNLTNKSDIADVITGGC